MPRRFCVFVLIFFFLALSLSGCAKKIVRLPGITAPVVENPVDKLLEAFSTVDSLEAKASIRIETVRMGEEMHFLLNGFLIYQKPDKLRIQGYHPLGMGVFDALYLNGEFFLLSPLQKKAFSGRVSEFQDLIEKAGIRISFEKPEGSEIPNRIRIEAVEKETRVELRLKEISVNSSLPADSFDWVEPEGVEMMPLSRLLRGKGRK